MEHTNVVERGARVRFPPPLVFVIGILLGVACGYVVGPAPVPVPRSIGAIAGVVLLLASLGIAAWARTGFTRTGQSPLPWKPTPSLIFEGPYRFTRNPMYLAFTLADVGLGLAANSLWIAVFAIPALVAVHFIAVLPEERYLSAKFGESYTTYLTRVRRYL